MSEDRGRAMMNPARAGFFPASQAEKEITPAATNSFTIEKSIFN